MADVVAQVQAFIDSKAELRSPFGYIKLTGLDRALRYTFVERGRLDLEWTVDPCFCFKDGFVHGGLINVVADLAQTTAFWTTSEGPEAYSTIDFHTRFLRPIKSDSLIRVESRVTNRSRRTGLIESRFIDAATEKLHAVVTGGWTLTTRDFG
jgi:uncharacterized protein (TIGR00369 family)